MNIAFRLDAHPDIGVGHLSRCSTLAAALRERGCRVLFVLRAPSPGIAAMVRQNGFELAELPAWGDNSMTRDLPHASWRGGNQADDARQTAEAIERWTGGPPCDWLVVDHYGLDRTWENALRPFTRRLLVVDDLADRNHDADVLLDVNAYLAPQHRYAGKVPDGCTLLLGPRFVMLREEFESGHATPEPAGPLVVNISFGGTDPPNLTGKALSAIATLGVEVDVVLGPMNPHAASLREQWSRHANIHIHQDTRNIAALFARAHLAIGAAGSTTWERMRMGVPSILYSLAENQIRIGEDSALQGACVYMGKASEFCPDRLAACARILLRDNSRRRQLATAGKNLVPAGGVYRVANTMTPPALRLTIASEADSWLNPYIDNFISWLEHRGMAVEWVHQAGAIRNGDLCFLLGFGQLVSADTLARHRNNLVVHESDLPKGRGWSPMTWQILEGAEQITVTLFEAAVGVDAGPIYAQETINLDGTELVDEWRRMQANATFRLCRAFVEQYPQSALCSRIQSGDPTYYPKRKPEDSRLDFYKPLSDQFNLLRVCDNERYPAFFEWKGSRYMIRISKFPL